MKRIALLCLLLAGCAIDKQNPAYDPKTNYGFGWEYDAIAPSGVRLRYNSDAVFQIAPMPASDTIKLFEAVYLEAEACTNIFKSGPIVILVPPGSLDKYVPGTKVPIAGFTFYDTGLILITANGNALVKAAEEYVHYLLELSDFPRDQNTAHNSPLFKLCAPLTL